MNDKETFVNMLIDKTINGEKSWEQVSITPGISSFILNPDLVSEAFTTDFDGGEIYIIIQKYMKYFSDFEQYYEQFSKYIFVVNGGKLRYQVSENEVAENMLTMLLAEIREKNEKGFFEKFIKDLT